MCKAENISMVGNLLKLIVFNTLSGKQYVIMVS
jgi:hypothetical protein